MGPKKRRGRKQSLEDRTVASWATEVTTLVSGDDGGAGEAQVAPEAIEVEEHVAQVLSPVTSDRKLSSAVLVLENCLLTPPQPRNSLPSPVAIDDAIPPARPGRKRKPPGVRGAAAGKSIPTEEGGEADVCVVEETIPEPKQRVVKRQKREVVRRGPRQRSVAVESVVVESVVVTTVVADEPISDVDVESGAGMGDGDGEICLEAGVVPPEECTVGVKLDPPGADALLEKRKRRKTVKKGKHAAKKRRKDAAEEEEAEHGEEIQVDDDNEEEEEDEEDEAGSFATWVVSPLSGDEERMIFKRQRKITPPDSEAGGGGGIPEQCLPLVPADGATDFVGNVPLTESPVDAVFVDPMDVEEIVDVEVICTKGDDPVGSDSSALGGRKSRRGRKKGDLKSTSGAVKQLGSEGGVDAGVDPGGSGQKRKGPARKNLAMRVVEGCLDPVVGPRVTRRRRNGNGGVTTEARSLSAGEPLFGNEKVAEDVRSISSVPDAEIDSLECPAVQENSTVVCSLEEPSPKDTAVLKLPSKRDEFDTKAEPKNRKKRGRKRKMKPEEPPSSAGGSEEDRSSAASIRSEDGADVDEMTENAPRDGTTGNCPAATGNYPTATGNYPAAVLTTCAPVTCQPVDPGSLESRRDPIEGIAAGSNSESVSIGKSVFSGTLAEKSDVLLERYTEYPNIALPAHSVSNDSTLSEVNRKDGGSDGNPDIPSSIVEQKTPEENDLEKSPSSRRTTPTGSVIQSEESPIASRINPEQGTAHSDSTPVFSHSTEEKSDNNALSQTMTAAPASPLLSLECYSEAVAATSDSDQSPVVASNHIDVSNTGGTPKPGETSNIPTSRGSVPTTNGESSKKEMGNSGDVENPLSDATARDRKPDSGSGDDTGFVPLKKRRLRMAETAAEVAAAGGEKAVPEDAVPRASGDARKPVDAAPVNNAEVATIEKGDGLQLVRPASDLVAVTVPCGNLLPKANKYVGTHVLAPGDLAGAVLRASQLGARALGIFIKPQKTWTPPPLDPQEAARFKEALKEKGYSPHMVVPHGSYLLNCGSSDAEHLSKSRESLVDDLKRCQMLGLPLFNFHPGAYSDSDTVENCVGRVADSINYVHGKVSDVITVIENMSGEANSVGHTFEQLKQVIDKVVDKSRIGVCLDTCHAFAAGHDLRSEAGYRKLMEDFDSTIGRKYLKAVHINDSQGELGSRVDHHASIGKGKIGLTCFRLIMSDRSLENIPLILETPIAGHKQEIELLYSFV